MLDKSIDGALLTLRKQIIRGDGEGLEHVEALLILRRVQMPRVMPAKRPDVARRGTLKLLLLSALRDGPKTLQEVVAFVAVHRPNLSHADNYKRTQLALLKLRMKGVVVRNCLRWELADCSTSPNRFTS